MILLEAALTFAVFLVGLLWIMNRPSRRAGKGPDTKGWY